MRIGALQQRADQLVGGGLRGGGRGRARRLRHLNQRGLIT